MISSSQAVPNYLKDYVHQYKSDPRGTALQWFRDAKFGMFIHYALASLLPHGKEDLQRMAGGTKQDLKALERGVRDDRIQSLREQLLQQFTATDFDADFITDLALNAKMRYVNFTTKHIGGLYMFDTKVSRFTSLHSPAKRDFVAEIADACDKKGLGLFLYVPPDTARTDDEFIEHNHIILRELLTQYGQVAGIWFDGINACYHNPELYERISETFSLIRSLQPQCLISFKQGYEGSEDFVSPEHMMRPVGGEKGAEQWEKIFKYKPAEINTTMQECRNRDGIGVYGGWINDIRARHLNKDEVLNLLKNARCHDANLNLNVGLESNGSVHPNDIHTLREVGKWLRENGWPEESSS